MKWFNFMTDFPGPGRYAGRRIEPLDHGVVGGVFVKVTQRRVVEAGPVENFRVRPGQQRHEADVNQLRGLLADYVDAEQPQIVAAEDQFQKTGFVADDLPARIVRVTGAAYEVINLFFLERLLGFAGHARLGNCVNTRRQNGRNVLLKAHVEGMADRDARLLHAGRGQRGRPHDVAGGVNMRHRAAKMFIHHHQSALARSEAGGGEVKILGVAAAAGADQHAVAGERGAGGQRQQHVAGLRAVARRDAFLPVELHAVGGHRLGERDGNFTVEKRQQHVAPVNQVNLRAQRRERAGVFATHHAAADHDQFFRQHLEVENFIRVMHPVVLELKFRRTHRRRTGGDENFVAAQQRDRALVLDHLDGVRVHEARRAVKFLDAVGPQALLQPVAFIGGHLFFVVH